MPQAAEKPEIFIAESELDTFKPISLFNQRSDKPDSGVFCPAMIL